MMTARDIQREVAAEFGLTREAMLFHGSGRGKVLARKTAMYRCRTELGMSYPEIGVAFNIHHTTVIHHIGKTDAAKLSRETIPSLEALIRKQARIIAQQARSIATLADTVERLSAR